MSDLPTGWAKKHLREVLTFNYGRALPEKVRQPGSIPVYGSNGRVGFHNEALIDGPAIIIGRKGSVGEVHFSGDSCWPIDTTYFVNEFGESSPGFWFWYLKYLKLGALDRATAIPGLNREDAYELSVFVPPLNEQRRITARLDELLAQSTRARSELTHVPGLVERQKQAELEKVFSCELTREWRQERGLSDPPLTKLFELCTSITDGDHQAPPKADSGVPFITISAISNGKLQLSQATRFVPKLYLASLKPSRKPQRGDVLFSVTGSIAIPAFVDTDDEFVFQRHIAILKPDYQVTSGRFLTFVLGAPQIKEQAYNVATGTAQLTIPLSGLREFLVPKPSQQEQQEIIRRIESAFARIDRAAAETHSAIVLLDRLDQETLAKAFRGELVQQDPNDEPASVFLERIRALPDMQAVETKERFSRKGSMTKITRDSIKEIIRQLPKEKFSFDELRRDVSGDYEVLREIVFALLDEAEPSLVQIFDQEAKALRFVRRQA